MTKKKHEFKRHDLVKVSKTSEYVYRISWIDGHQCQIQERKPDGGWYSAQSFDTSLLIPYEGE